jgi:hypothetical protein
MIWQTWRQHRAEAGVGALVLVALASAMLVVGHIARDRASRLGLPAACTGAGGGCNDLGALVKLHGDFHSIPPFTAALIAVPLLAGMFWAAPLVSREYEAGTHRLAWTQSVSPLRWITVKIALIFGVLAAGALGLGLLATWTLDPLVVAFGGRYNSTWYDVQGIVPVACMLFALGVGVATSALIRRTIPAMAATLVAYAVARIPIHWIRPNFAPVAVRNLTVPLRTLLGHSGPVPSNLVTPTLSPGDWLQSFTVTDSAGHAVPTNNGLAGLIRHYCPNALTPGSGSVHIDSLCQSTLQTQSLHETIRYQPASHFWFIQTVESAIFLAIAAVLITTAIIAVTRRRPT